jgi:hypothetical protein
LKRVDRNIIFARDAIEGYKKGGLIAGSYKGNLYPSILVKMMKNDVATFFFKGVFSNLADVTDLYEYENPIGALNFWTDILHGDLFYLENYDQYKDLLNNKTGGLQKVVIPDGEDLPFYSVKKVFEQGILVVGIVNNQRFPLIKDNKGKYTFVCKGAVFESVEEALTWWFNNINVQIYVFDNIEDMYQDIG